MPAEPWWFTKGAEISEGHCVKSSDTGVQSWHIELWGHLFHTEIYLSINHRAASIHMWGWSGDNSLVPNFPMHKTAMVAVSTTKTCMGRTECYGKWNLSHSQLFCGLLWSAHYQALSLRASLTLGQGTIYVTPSKFEMGKRMYEEVREVGCGDTVSLPQGRLKGSWDQGQPGL